MKTPTQQLSEGFSSATAAADRNPQLLVLALSLLYIGVALPLSSVKLLWEDEFFTLYISSSPSLTHIWTALSTGADQHPPLFYWLTHQLLSAFGVSHLVVRSPAFFGIWLMALSIFLFVWRRLGALYGFAASLFSLQTGALAYAYEARGYGLMLGFCAAALLFWQLTADNIRRRTCSLALAASLALAVSSHYYSVCLLAPLAIAELVRTRRTGKLDPLVWCALCSPLIPLLIAWPLLRSARVYAATFWARPAWSFGYEYYGELLQSAAPALTGFAILCCLLALLAPEPGPSPGSPRPGLKIEEIVLSCGLAILPLAVLAMAKFVTNGFHSRYALAGIIGVTLVTITAVYLLSSGSRRAALALAISLIFVFLPRGLIERRQIEGKMGVIADSSDFLTHNSLPKLPIVISEVTEFYRLSFYAPEPIAGRLLYLSSPPDSLKYLGQDTPDRGLLALRSWFPLRVEAYHEYIHSHSRFLVFGYVQDWSWLSFGLLRDGFRLRLVGRSDDRVLLVAERPSPQGSPTETAAGYLAAQSKFSIRNRNQKLTHRTASLCQRWTEDTICQLFFRPPRPLSHDELQELPDTDPALAAATNTRSALSFIDLDKVRPDSATGR